MRNALLSILVALCSLSATHAANVVFDDFNEYSLGELPVGPAPDIWATALQNEFRSTTIEQDANAIFGHGTSNRFLNLTATRGSGGQSLTSINNTNFGTTAQISFQFYSPSNADRYANGWILRIGGGTSNGSTAFALSVQNGGLYLYTGNSIDRATDPFATYSLDTLNSLIIVLNNSTESIEYAGGSLLAQTMDVWLNNERVGHGLSSTGNVAAGTELQNVNFTSKADFRGVLYVDDFAISNTIMIPESGSLSLIGAAFASIAILLHIRRRR